MTATALTFSRDGEKVSPKATDEGSRRHPGDPQNSRAYSVSIGSDLFIREADDIEAHTLQVTRPVAIMNATVVLSPVDFNDQFGFEADEIRDVAALWSLASKLQVSELSIAQSPPQRLLNVGRMRTHLAGRATQKLAKIIIRQDD